jgi:hypothetical protein
MLNGAPVLFGSSCDLTDVPDGAVDIAAVQAVGFLDCIQIGKLMAVDREVSPALHTFDSVDGKTNPLIQADPHVEEDEGETERIDDRRREQVEHAAVAEKGGDALLQPPVGLPHLLVEPAPSPTDARPRLPLLIVDVLGEGVVRVANIGDDTVDMPGHGSLHFARSPVDQSAFQ